MRIKRKDLNRLVENYLKSEGATILSEGLYNFFVDEKGYSWKKVGPKSVRKKIAQELGLPEEVVNGIGDTVPNQKLEEKLRTLSDPELSAVVKKALGEDPEPQPEPEPQPQPDPAEVPTSDIVVDPDPDIEGDEETFEVDLEQLGRNQRDDEEGEGDDAIRGKKHVLTPRAGGRVPLGDIQVFKIRIFTHQYISQAELVQQLQLERPQGIKKIKINNRWVKEGSILAFWRSDMTNQILDYLEDATLVDSVEDTEQ
jgi:hypothetical protein